MLDVILVVASALFVLSLAYAIIAIVGVLRFGKALQQPPASDHSEPVTILKPLCGLEKGLAKNLRSFCDQQYETFQIVFGVRDKNDSAIPIIKKIMAEFPGHNISLVIDDRIIGTNLKISNLANMMAVAKYDVIAISDSDMRVGRDYLKTIVQPFKDDTVGAVTCLYSGRPINGLPSKLGATYINDWFLPSALIPATFGSLTYCFGATMAVRRKMFLGLGGFGALADFLADDYMLGHLVSDAGHKIVLAPYVVENVISETSLKSLFSHELRWARTIKSVQPFGYALSFITELLPLSVLTMVPIYLATGSALLAGAVVCGAFAMRISLHYAVSVTVPGGGPFAPWLIPLRDLLTASVRITSYFGTKVLWRESAFEIQTGNQLKIVE